MKLHNTLYILLLFVVCCTDTKIDPFEINSRYFSVYGAMNTDSTINYIRIKDVQTPLLSPVEELDTFSATLENLQTNKVKLLEKKVVVFNENPTLNFIVDEVFLPRSSYKLTVTGDNGEVATSIATTPGNTSLTLTPEVTEECSEEILIEFDDVKEPEFIRFELGVRYERVMYYAEIKTVAPLVKVPGTNKVQVSLSITNMLVDLFPPAESSIGISPRFWIPTIGCYDLDEKDMIIRYTHFGPEWKVLKDNNLAFDVLDSSDIENGLGFFGAIDRGELRFRTNGVPD
jgi:hypothetical protein